jgi:hypothetical protein
MRHMPWVRTVPLDLSGEAESGSKELFLESPDSLIRFTPERVTVHYQIETLEANDEAGP